MKGRHLRVDRRPASPAPLAGWLLLGQTPAQSAGQAPMHLTAVHHVWTVALGITLMMAQTRVQGVSLAPLPLPAAVLCAPLATQGNLLDTASRAAMTAGLVPLLRIGVPQIAARVPKALGHPTGLLSAHHARTVLRVMSAKWPHVTPPRVAHW